MIDLGDELAGFGEELPRPTTFDGDGFPVGRNGSDVRVGPNGMRTFGKLADLKKGGFNVNPRTGRGIGDPHRDVDDQPSWLDRIAAGLRQTFLPDPLTDDSRWTFAGTLDDDDKIDVKTWFGYDVPDVPVDQQFPNPSALVDFVVPDQPFDYRPQITATHNGKPINPVCEHGRMIWSCWACTDLMT